MRWEALASGSRLRARLRAACAAALLAWATSACLPVAGPGDGDRGTAAFAARAGSGASARGASAAQPPFLMPVAGVRVQDVVGSFGAPRGRRIHEGLDIMAPEGTHVYAAAAGTVAFAGRTPLGGWTVRIDGAGRAFWYTHLQAIAPDLAEGVRVTPATLIGRVGRTGNAAGGPPHLHFEIVTASGPVDPLPLLRDRS